MTTTATRAQLQQYFATNCIPTQSNFSDLFAAMLNQADDGVFKSAGNPLGIASASDTTSSQKVLNLYVNASDTNPAWTLQLNPRSNQNDPATAHKGFSVSDATGASRLFIDAGTYNVGIGTNTPAAKLDINGGANVGGALSVIGAANLNNTLTVTGATILNNALTVSGASNVGGVLKVSGAASMNNTLTVTGAATLNNNLTVSGPASFSNSLTVSAGNVRIGYDDQNNGTGRIVCFQKDIGDEGNAGKIIYKPQGGGWTANSQVALNILGAGSSYGTRNIMLWDNVEVGKNLTVDGNLSVTGKITGKISSPMWNVTSVFNNKAAPSAGLPMSGTFTCNGGTLLIFVSGSGRYGTGNYVYNNTGDSLMSIDVDLDSVLLGNLEVYSNLAASHMSFIPNLFVKAGVASGSHTIQLSTSANYPHTITDNNDYFTVVVMELPF